MKWITASDLERWAASVASRTDMSKLVSRLVRASAPNQQSFRFPTGDSAEIPGYDGILESEEMQPYVPGGISVWEFGTNQDPQKKAQSDYRDRTSRPGSVTPSNTTFVFVTPRVWVGWEKWRDRKQKAKNKKWKDVRVIDGIALEDWLERNPAVAADLARQILRNVPQTGARSTDEFWDEYSFQFDPALTEKALLAGRAEQADLMRQHLLGQAQGHLWQAYSLEEVTAFSLAAIRSADGEVRKYLEARTLILDSEQAANELANRRDLIFLVRGGALPLSGLLSSRNIPVVVPVGRDQPNKGDATNLRIPGYDELADALQSMGMSEETAQRRARECGRSITILKRRIRRAHVSGPDWGEVQNLVPALLASSWESASDRDKAALETLARGDYGQYDKSLLPYLRKEDPPLERVGSVWQLRAPVDAFVHLGHLIGLDDLTRFKEMAHVVYGEHDPGLGLSREERFYASFSGKKLGHSDWLRTGIATTLLMIAVFHEEAGLEIAGGAQAYVDRLVSEIPGLSQEYMTIASLYSILPLIAEAAPRPLLHALSRLAEGDGNALLPLFRDDAGLFYTSSPHTAVLRALEVLAWDPDYFDDATFVLAKLARFDPGGKLVNRPINSLREIFLPWRPGTNASIDQRVAALDQIIAREPGVGWDLLVKLLPEHHSVSTTTTKPRYREAGASNVEAVTYGIIGRTYKQIVDRVLNLAGDNPDRWTVIIHQLYALSPDDRAKAISLLKALSPPQDTAARNVFWNALRREVNRHRRFSATEWAMRADDMTELDEIASKFLPTDLITQTSWLFEEYSPDLPEGGDIGQYELVPVRRKEAVSRVFEASGISGVIALARAAKLPAYVGYAFVDAVGELGPVAALAEAYLREKAQPDSFAIAVSAGADFKFRQNWRALIESILRTGVWTAEQVAILGLEFNDDLPTWEFVAGLGPITEREYWSRKSSRPLNLGPEKLEYAARKYLQVGRAVAAIDAIAFPPELPSSAITMAVLDQAISEINATPSLVSSSFAFDVGRILDSLRTRPEVPRIEIAMREYAYLPLLEHTYLPRRGAAKAPLTIYELLSQEPELFVQVLCDVFRPASGPDRDVAKESRERAAAGYRLISGFHTLPGVIDGTINEQQLRVWIERVRELAGAEDRAKIADQHIGHLLAHAPMDDDGGWPHRTVRELIEELASPEVEKGILVERVNMRGGYQKALFEGGKQERQLAAEARKWSKMARRRSRTSALLRTLAEGWDRQAEDADLRAKQDEMKS
jgi:hypothetical protein